MGFRARLHLVRRTVSHTLLPTTYYLPIILPKMLYSPLACRMWKHKNEHRSTNAQKHISYPLPPTVTPTTRRTNTLVSRRT
jgi:hypothetical protein